MLLDNPSDDGENVAKAKAKKPTAARDKSEKRVRRKKADAPADTEDMVSFAVCGQIQSPTTQLCGCLTHVAQLMFAVDAYTRDTLW